MTNSLLYPTTRSRLFVPTQVRSRVPFIKPPKPAKPPKPQEPGLGMMLAVPPMQFPDISGSDYWNGNDSVNFIDTAPPGSYPKFNGPYRKRHPSGVTLFREGPDSIGTHANAHGYLYSGPETGRIPGSGVFRHPSPYAPSGRTRQGVIDARRKNT